MKFFTKEWLTGQLTDEEYEKVIPAYRRHRANILPELSSNLLDFFKVVNIHDGTIRKVIIDYTYSTLGLYLRCGDLQVGYYDVDIQYQGIQLDKSVVDMLVKMAHDSNTLLYDELDVTDSKMFVHNIIFESEDAVSLIFQDLVFEKTMQNGPDFPIAIEKVSIIS
jgi:hypothetical protein